ncbi:hypothetical protein AN639_07555 [Candidatus Epulonipiscium fishelsonii]|uniref:Uncharacterized protein n=1 Tax=Candidatus Epulonipiscium fishelsonii TaxID=77094 RepID=A0ACC8XET7_9FIRM|nr:hypothetical protein AN639_07555 [Epulopiscium sp. SCG-B05WGA-EpuloA1]ONI41885.1 hypothetical protein AN396_02815 [Epulopiscium sp. SCG-B11WGA-EpuloA1]
MKLLKILLCFTIFSTLSQNIYAKPSEPVSSSKRTSTYTMECDLKKTYYVGDHIEPDIFRYIVYDPTGEDITDSKKLDVEADFDELDNMKTGTYEVTYIIKFDGKVVEIKTYTLRVVSKELIYADTIEFTVGERLTLMDGVELEDGLYLNQVTTKHDIPIKVDKDGNEYAETVGSYDVEYYVTGQVDPFIRRVIITAPSGREVPEINNIASATTINIELGEQLDLKKYITIEDDAPIDWDEVRVYCLGLSSNLIPTAYGVYDLGITYTDEDRNSGRIDLKLRVKPDTISLVHIPNTASEFRSYISNLNHEQHTDLLATLEYNLPFYASDIHDTPLNPDVFAFDDFNDDFFMLRARPLNTSYLSIVKKMEFIEVIPWFLDTKDHWAEAAIYYVAERNLMENDVIEFFPDNEVSLNEAIEYIARVAFYNDAKIVRNKMDIQHLLAPVQYYEFYHDFGHYYSITSPISDVPYINWYSLFEGITRQQMADLIAPVLTSQDYYWGNNYHSFSDNSSESVEILASYGFYRGLLNTEFYGNSLITRGELAVMLMRLDQLLGS